MAPPYRPRDSRGWCVPAKGTVARKVYDLMLETLPRGEIAKRLKITPNYVGIMSWRIRHPGARLKFSYEERDG